MPSSNRHCVDAGILDDASSIGCAIAKAEFLRGVVGVGPRRGTDGCQPCIGGCFQSGDERSRGKYAGTEQSDGNGIRRRKFRRGLGCRSRRQKFESPLGIVAASSGILNHDSEKWPTRLPAGEFVRTLSAFDWKAVGDERSNFDFPFGEELKKRFHFPGFL